MYANYDYTTPIVNCVEGLHVHYKKYPYTNGQFFRKSHGTGPYIVVPFINGTIKKHVQHVGLFFNVFQPYHPPSIFVDNIAL